MYSAPLLLEMEILMLMGVGGLWGHMGGRLRVGWKAGFGVSLVIDV